MGGTDGFDIVAGRADEFADDDNVDVAADTLVCCVASIGGAPNALSLQCCVFADVDDDKWFMW